MGDRKMGKFVRGSGGIMVQNHGRRKKLRDANSSVSGIRQYSQRKPAREATSRRRAGLIRSAMRVAGTGLGFGEDQQMLKLFILVQLAFLIWGKPLLLPLADKLPYPSPRGFG